MSWAGPEEIFLSTSLASYLDSNLSPLSLSLYIHTHTYILFFLFWRCRLTYNMWWWYGRICYPQKKKKDMVESGYFSDLRWMWEMGIFMMVWYALCGFSIRFLVIWWFGVMVLVCSANMLLRGYLRGFSIWGFLLYDIWNRFLLVFFFFLMS